MSAATPAPYALGAALLAAGRSTRMGRPKLLLPWGRTTILGHLLKQWQELGARQAGVVCVESDAELQAELDRLGFPRQNRIYNPAPERGMFSSIQCASRWPGWQAGLTHWAIVLGDQPHLRVGILQTLLSFAAEHPQQVCLPLQGGHRRHPVILPRPAFQQLGASNVSDLKAFLESPELALCPLNDPALALDIDRPGDYEKALALRTRT